MSIFARNTAKAPTLTEQLAEKGRGLRIDQSNAADLSRQHLVWAQEESARADKAAAHALAVEQAFTILDEAGVEL